MTRPRVHKLLGLPLASLLLVNPAIAFEASGKLEIHYINVGQGGSTLIIGPDGTRILYDFGDLGRGTAIVDYLRNAIDLAPEEGLDFAIVSHRDRDHYGGYVDVIDAGYDVIIKNYDSGSNKPATPQMGKVWLNPARERTKAGAVTPIPVGSKIPLGDGAEVRVIAANGRIHKHTATLPSARNENDRSISLYIKYGMFDYILDGDLGSGPEACTAHDTSQRNFQVPVAKALVALGWMKSETGVDVLHIAHHGSESSTSGEYYNLMKPEVGLTSVGLNQGSFLHPREDVVEKILIGGSRASPPCVTAPALRELFQTEDGKRGDSSTGSTSFGGSPIGDIKLITDGKTTYQISGSGRVNGGRVTRNPPEGVWCFALDDLGSDAAEEVDGCLPQ